MTVNAQDTLVALISNSTLVRIGGITDEWLSPGEVKLRSS